MQARRNQQLDKDAPDDFLDCESCMVDFTVSDRRNLHCGWLDEREHPPDGDRPFPEASVCPGYLVRFPEVCEAARARAWASKGELAAFYGPGRLPPVAADAIDVLESASNAEEAREWRERRRKAEG